MVLHPSAQGWGRERANAHLTSSRLVDEIHLEIQKTKQPVPKLEAWIAAPAFKINNFSCYLQQFVDFLILVLPSTVCRNKLTNAINSIAL
jgi:hypothetical protein